MFASRSLKEKSCSMEVFFSFIVVVCSSGMMFPGSFRLFVTWKYKSRKFYRNKVGRFSFHWSEVFSYEKKNQKKYWKKRHTENDNKYRVILFVCNSQGFNVSNNDLNKRQWGWGWGWGCGGGGGGTLLTATRLDVLTGRKKLSTGSLALYLSCEGKGANRC